jgi:uncharacterized membrane protein YvbJ
MKTRYFCENCGNEVRAGAASCPSCGRAFTAVRCPKCGFEGTAAQFKNGCPACGYMVPVRDAPVEARPVQSGPSAARSRLPAWVYTVAAIALLGTAILLLGLLFFRA